MKNHNYYEGKFTLNRSLILRKSNTEYKIYDIRYQKIYTINSYFYNVLRLFQKNCTNLTQIEKYFVDNNIPNYISNVNQLLEDKNYIKNLLVTDSLPSKTEDIYKYISINKHQLQEYTPVSIDFLITNRCNLSCPHCYRNSTAKDSLNPLNLERIYRLLDEMEQLNVFQLKITGGEPFLCKDLFNIVEYGVTKSISIAILSNATIPLNEAWLNLLAHKNITLNISLDGATPDTHDVIRGKGAFNRTIQNLHKFTQYNISYAIMFTINNTNKHEVQDVISLIENNFKIRELGFNFVEKHGRAKEDDKDLFSLGKKEVQEIKREINRLAISSSLNITISDNNAFASTTTELDELNAKGNKVYCKGGTHLLAIDSNLAVYPCIFGIGGVKEYPVGNLNEDSLLNIWSNNRQLDVFRGSLNIEDLSKCSSCNLKSRCKLKSCRLKAIYSGYNFLDPVPHCLGMTSAVDA